MPSVKKESSTPRQIRSRRELAGWTKNVVQAPVDAPMNADGVSKKRFDSEETAARAAIDHVSAEAMVKLLSPGNIAILEAIRLNKPVSVRALAMLTGRREPSLSRTLNRLAEIGIVSLEDGPRQTRIPVLIARRVYLEIDLPSTKSL